MRINQKLKPIKLTKKQLLTKLPINWIFILLWLFVYYLDNNKTFIILADKAILEYDISKSFFIYKVNCSNDIKAEVITHLK